MKKSSKKITIEAIKRRLRYAIDVGKIDSREVDIASSTFLDMLEELALIKDAQELQFRWEERWTSVVFRSNNYFNKTPGRKMFVL